ncbi:MAG: hypothetical protein RIR69_276 [Actinomycetota bacterium]
MPQHDDRFNVIEAGFTGDEKTARDGLGHHEPEVRASAIRALFRMKCLHSGDIEKFLDDENAEVRRTAVECAVEHHDVSLTRLLNDTDVFVAEMAAWCLGEQPVTDDALRALIEATLHHREAVVREASAAALGSLGDARGMNAILHACTDKPAVRRRAILALAPFEGPEVDQALQTALSDRDWQVRQNAEILISPRERTTE